MTLGSTLGVAGKGLHLNDTVGEAVQQLCVYGAQWRNQDRVHAGACERQIVDMQACCCSKAEAVSVLWSAGQRRQSTEGCDLLAANPLHE